VLTHAEAKGSQHIQVLPHWLPLEAGLSISTVCFSLFELDRQLVFVIYTSIVFC